MATGISLSEKKRLWETQKYDKYEQISKDKSSIFNYFILNNDIFQMINEKDELAFKFLNHYRRIVEVRAQEEKMRVLYSSLGAIFFVDQVIFRFLLPKYKIPNYRFTVNASKYVLLPCIIYGVYKEYFMDSYEQFFFNMQDKYSFGFLDYMKANRIFQRALFVDRLQQLLDKREKFDWTGVPELPDDQFKRDLKKI